MPDDTLSTDDRRVFGQLQRIGRNAVRRYGVVTDHREGSIPAGSSAPIERRVRAPTEERNRVF